jgi:nucleoside-diphosphate-sugar epimerase
MMKILVTGATGYVGRRVAERLVARGEDVAGSVRHIDRAASLPAGVTPVVLDFAEPDAWGKAALPVEAVVHTAFATHIGDWQRAVVLEHDVVASFLEAMSGTGKTLIVSNGTAFLGDSGDRKLAEDAPVPDGPTAVRAAATAQVRSPRATGLRAIEVRLASFVYGHGGSVFLPVLVAAALRDGRSIYVDEGSARTSALHVDDAAAGYLAALDRGRHGAIYHLAAKEEPSIRDIAGAVAKAAGNVPLVSVDLAEASTRLDPFTAWFLTLNNRLDSGLARLELGWTPQFEEGLLHDVAEGSYKRSPA